MTIESGIVAATDPIAAEIVVGPSDMPAVNPEVGSTVATDGVPDVHVARVVTFPVVASEYVPVAVNCRTSPIPENPGLGVIAID